jgi:23S rRNA pseudouridine1911/1915/1917 synthase
MNDLHPSAAIHRVAAEPADAGERLDRFLARRLHDAPHRDAEPRPPKQDSASGAVLSRVRLKALIEAGHVARGGVTLRDPSHRVKPGDSFEIAVPPPEPAEPAGQAIPLIVVHEDRHLIVVDKPAGLVVHPAPGNADGTLVNALIAHCGPELSGIGGVCRPGIVHRLDKDTSGLIVAAKTDQAHHGLADLFARHDLDRAYRAVVWGAIRPLVGTIASAIGRDSRQRQRMAVVGHGGRHAVTYYRVLKPLGALASLVECTLETGRTHQIRVHLAHIGCPVVGDPAYGRGRRKPPMEGFARQALHAFRLGFRHPVTGKSVKFESELPEDMQRLISAFEAR